MDNKESKFTKEEQLRIDAVRNLLRHSDDPEDKINLSYIDQFERQANMTTSEKIKDLASDNSLYKDDRMKQRFGSIKRITSIRGSIFIEVDEDRALKAAKNIAFRVLGPLADPDTYKKFVAENTSKSTVMSIKTFLRNIKSLATMVSINPDAFGAGKGGGEIRNILEDAKGAISDARAYLKKHRLDMPEGAYDLMMGGNLQVTDPKQFATYIGEDWRKELTEKAKAEEASKLLFGNL